MDKEQIKTNLRQAIGQCQYRDAIKSMAIYGSYVNGQPGDDSDIDVLVEFTDTARIGLFDYVRLRRQLSEFLGIEVDLVTKDALSKYIRQQVLKEAEFVL